MQLERLLKTDVRRKIIEIIRRESKTKLFNLSLFMKARSELHLQIIESEFSIVLIFTVLFIVSPNSSLLL